MVKLINCFKKSSFERIQLGMSFEDFQTLWSPTKPLTKLNLISEQNTFACFLNGAEFIFEENNLNSVKIEDMPLFFAESKQAFTNLTFDKTTQLLQQNGWDWKIYEKYTKGQWIVIHYGEIAYEFTIISNKLRLKLIRVGKIYDKMV
jgi:hypothetical protein